MSKKKTNTATADSRPKRRWLNIGPGLVIALAIAALIGSQWIKTEMSARRQHSAPPIIERQVVISSDDEKSGPTPEISFILDRAQKLHLSDAQQTQLRALQSEWQKIYGPKLAAARQAADKTSAYLADAASHSRTPAAQIQDAAAPVIALSREISSGRRSYWDRAVKSLSPQQRKAVQAEREAGWSAKKASVAGSEKRVGE